MMPLVPHRVSSAVPSTALQQRIAVLGSTGSIGESTLAIVRSDPARFRVEALVARRNITKLLEQTIEFRPSIVALEEESAADQLQAELKKREITGVEVISGSTAAITIATLPEVDTVVAAMVGSVGLLPVLEALKANKRVALANKETLVAGGCFVREILQRGTGQLLPVDSEHSAIFQAREATDLSSLEQVLLTASGGPFLNVGVAELATVTPEQAVKHPRWNMGAKISVDSATMMNKALEVIEAAWLFGLSESHIEVVIHPESIVHSAIRLRDGSVIAQLSVPDMCGPIAYALTYPDQRATSIMPRLDFAKLAGLTFKPLDNKRFPAVSMARECLRQGGSASAVFNASNEVAVERFLAHQIPFPAIMSLIDSALSKFGTKSADSIAELLALEREVRDWTRSNNRVS